MKEITIMNHEWFDSFFGKGRVTIKAAIKEANRPEEGTIKTVLVEQDVRCVHTEDGYTWEVVEDGNKK